MLRKILIWGWLWAWAAVLPGAEIQRIHCTTYPVWLLTRSVAAGATGLVVDLVIPPNAGCPHDYVLTAQDLRKLSDPGSIVICNGLGLDDFVLQIVRKRRPDAGIIIAASSSDALAQCADDGDSHHHAGEIAWNAHLFASPDTAIPMVRRIAAELSARDESRAGLYRRNSLKFIAALEELVQRGAALKCEASPLPRPPATVVIQHGIFAYLARLTGVQTIEMASSDEETTLSGARLRTLVLAAAEKKARAIWTEPHSPRSPVLALARECRLPIVEFDLLSGGPENPPPDYYLQVMTRNLETLEKTLKP